MGVQRDVHQASRGPLFGDDSDGLRLVAVRTVSASVVGRNLRMWAKAPNIDPESVFSPYQLAGSRNGAASDREEYRVEITIVP